MTATSSSVPECFPVTFATSLGDGEKMGLLEDIMDGLRIQGLTPRFHTCPQALLSRKIILYPQVMENPRSENLPSTVAIGIS